MAVWWVSSYKKPYDFGSILGPLIYGNSHIAYYAANRRVSSASAGVELVRKNQHTMVVEP